MTCIAAPVDNDGVQSFWGLAGYYSRHIKGFTELAKPLTSILGSTTVFEWISYGQASFKNLKGAAATGPVFDQSNF